MQRLQIGMLVVLVLFTMTGCFLLPGASNPTPGAQSQPTDSPVATPTEAAPPGTLVLSFSLSEYIKAKEPIEATVSLIGDEAVSELSFTLPFPIMYLFVNDADTIIEGLQGRPAALPDSATIVENYVSSDNVFHFRVTGLGVGEKANRAIVTLNLYPISTADSPLPIEFKDMVALGSEGQTLPIMGRSVLVNITEDGTSPPVVEASPTVTTTVVSAEAVSPTATLPPTPVPTDTPLPTPEPTATSVPPTSTATPLPPTPTPVPPTPTSFPASGIAPGVYYRIQRGETLYRIAHRYGTTPVAIAEATGIPDVTRISVGTLLRIPVQPANGQAMYIVSMGDTFYNVATTFGLSTQTLAARNPLIAPHYLQPGQWIILEP